MKNNQDTRHSATYIFFLLCLWLVYGVYIMYSAYFKELYISPDSSNYLREAEAMCTGYGFNHNGRAGVPGWFSAWPAGYPGLIALSCLVFRCNSYLCSKFLTIILVGLELFILGKRYKAKSWLYALVLSNVGIVLINRFTWSETAFMPLLLIYTLALSEILRNPSCGAGDYAVLGLAMCGAFLVRYFGIFTVMTSILAALFLILGGGGKSETSRGTKLLAVTIASGLFMAAYLFMNKVMGGYVTGVDRARFDDDLLKLSFNLLESIVLEVRNVLSFLAKLIHIRNRYWAVIAVPALCAAACVIFRRLRSAFNSRVIDEASTFFIVGLCYYAAFTAIRFRSSMDPFGYRFWAPASMLILFGLVSCFFEAFHGWNGETTAERRIQFAASVIMIALSLFMCFRMFTIGADNTAYDRIHDETVSYFDGVPAGTAVLFRDVWTDEDGEKHKGEEYSYSYANFFRKDVVISRVFRDKTYTLEELRESYRDYKYIAVSKFCYEDELTRDDSDWLFSWLRSLPAMQDSASHFIIIPVSRLIQPEPL